MKNLDSVIEEMRKIFVTREFFDVKFTPVEKIVYTFVSLTMVTVVGAILSLVVIRGK